MKASVSGSQETMEKFAKLTGLKAYRYDDVKDRLGDCIMEPTDYEMWVAVVEEK